ncbi:hypothetical protein [Chamaesiphon sp. OTE_75_metabat_556]|nr:hypothetical protein [Chamaesiphon sp. OTE_75_metabat_556]
MPDWSAIWEGTTLQTDGDYLTVDCTNNYPQSDRGQWQRSKIGLN